MSERKSYYVSPDGHFHETNLYGHGRWAHEHRDLVNLDADHGLQSDEDGNLVDPDAQDAFLRAGWVRVTGDGIEIGPLTHWTVVLVKDVVRCLARDGHATTYYVVSGGRLYTVPVTPTGRPDFSEIDAQSVADRKVRRYAK